MTRHYTRNDRTESIYQYLVVDVPAGAGALEVTLEYDRSETTLDLGLIGPDQFRGWSGSERAQRRRHRTVGDPRDICPAWSAGRGRSSSACTASRPAASTSPCTSRRPIDRPTPRRHRRCRPVPNARRARRLPAAPGHEWLAGDFHSHTVHSDGSLGDRRAGDAGCRARSRPARRHRPQHGQPSRPSRRGRRSRRDPPRARPRGHYRHRSRQLLRGDRLDRLPRPARRVAGRGDRARRPDVGQPPVGVGLCLADAPGRARRSRRDVALDVGPPRHDGPDRLADRSGRGRSAAATSTARDPTPSPGRRRRGWSAPTVPSTPCSTRCAMAASPSARRPTDRC